MLLLPPLQPRDEADRARLRAERRAVLVAEETGHFDAILQCTALQYDAEFATAEAELERLLQGVEPQRGRQLWQAVMDSEELEEVRAHGRVGVGGPVPPAAADPHCLSVPQVVVRAMGNFVLRFEGPVLPPGRVVLDALVELSGLAVRLNGRVEVEPPPAGIDLSEAIVMTRPCVGFLLMVSHGLVTPLNADTVSELLEEVLRVLHLPVGDFAAQRFQQSLKIAVAVVALQHCLLGHTGSLQPATIEPPLVRRLLEALAQPRDSVFHPVHCLVRLAALWLRLAAGWPEPRSRSPERPSPAPQLMARSSLLMGDPAEALRTMQSCPMLESFSLVRCWCLQTFMALAALGAIRPSRAQLVAWRAQYQEAAGHALRWLPAMMRSALHAEMQEVLCRLPATVEEPYDAIDLVQFRLYGLTSTLPRCAPTPLVPEVDCRRCSVCRVPLYTVLVCGWCRQQAYCGHRCQRQDWSRPGHRQTCTRQFGAV